MSDTTSGCPTCSGPIRETVGLVCQTCGTDYGAGPVSEAPVDSPWLVEATKAGGAALTGEHVLYENRCGCGLPCPTMDDYVQHMARLVLGAALPIITSAVAEESVRCPHRRPEGADLCGDCLAIDRRIRYCGSELSR